MLAFANDFATEIAFYDENRDSWCRQGRAGKYVTIHRNRRIGDFFDTFDAAMKAGYDEGLGVGEFLVEMVLPTGSHEWVSHISPSGD